jgi:hypothetical protein
LSIGEFALAGFFLNGDSGIVGHLLPQAGQAVKNCGFAGIGVPGQGDSECPQAGSGFEGWSATGRHQ